MTWCLSSQCSKDVLLHLERAIIPGSLRLLLMWGKFKIAYFNVAQEFLELSVLPIR